MTTEVLERPAEAEEKKSKLEIAAEAYPVPDGWSRPVVRKGAAKGGIVVVCEPSTLEADKRRWPMSGNSLERLAAAVKAAGLDQSEFTLVGLCQAMPKEVSKVDSKAKAFVHNHVAEVRRVVAEAEPVCVVPLGKWATYAVTGQVGGVPRGVPQTFDGTLVIPTVAPSQCNFRPEAEPVLRADLRTIAKLKRGGWNLDVLKEIENDYAWADDLQFLIDMCEQGKAKTLAVDTETTGVRWYDPAVRVLTVQICWKPGSAVAVAVDPEYRAMNGMDTDPAVVERLTGQLKRILENGRVKKIGANIKFDHHMLAKLGVTVRGWAHDVIQLAFTADENRLEFGLKALTKQYVPEMAGYSDIFDHEQGKENMLNVPAHEMLFYGCADTDATWRLAAKLVPLARADARNYNVYRRVTFPGLLSFIGVERRGLLVDLDALEALGRQLDEWLAARYRELIKLVPAKVKRAHLEAERAKYKTEARQAQVQETEVWRFSRDAFVRDILFTHEGGFRLKPQVWTKSTEDNDRGQQVPSVSAKEHLIYFADLDGEVGEFVRGLSEYKRVQTLRTNFVGSREEGTGLWQHIDPATGRVHPSYFLHTTVTGRTSSKNPNGQNFPKRGDGALGELVKAFRRVFKATPGWRIVGCDLSQAELRIAGWMAGERNMIRIYCDDGDIHQATAQATMRVTDEVWAALEKGEKKKKRNRAKGVNFGFLYGMGAKSFKAFAKTQYGQDFTEAESEETRERFFEKYPALPRWHRMMRDFVNEHGYVRSLHGALRRLPAIRSKEDGVRAEAERQAINSPVQRLGSDIGVLAMARFSLQADPSKFRMIGFVHDQLLMEVREGCEAEGIAALRWAMENTPWGWFDLTEPPLPIKADAEIGLNFGDAIELADLKPDSERPDWLVAAGIAGAVEAAKPSWWDDEKERRFYAGFGL